MATIEKKTIATLYGEILSQYELTDEHKAFIEKELGKVEKKKSSNSKAKEERATLNTARTEVLYQWLKDNGGQHQVKELTAKVSFDNVDFPSTAMVTNLLSNLIKEGKVVREVVKGTPKFSAR